MEASSLGLRLALGTVDDWICWNLTGGSESGVHVTDASNASRTLCYDIGSRSWSAELCDLFGVPMASLGAVLPSAHRYGTVAAGVAGGCLQGVPVSSIAGDQQAALFGHGCHQPGDIKVTYGTGSFVLMNLGGRQPPPTEGLLTTVAWDLGDHAPADAAEGFTYALEGSIFSSGATIQWLRDGLGLIGAAAEVGPLASRNSEQRRCVLDPCLCRPRKSMVGCSGTWHHRGPLKGNRAGPLRPGGS